MSDIGFVIILKSFFRKYTPKKEKLREQKSLAILGDNIYSPNLWHINRHSISGAFAVGLFCAWVPIPLQMLLAALMALVFSVNLPVSVALVWITNPITMPPMFYGAYWLGAKILNQKPQNINFELSGEWLGTVLGQIWQPFLLGCFVIGGLSSILGYFAVKWLWRYNTVRRFNKKKQRIL